MCDVAFLHTEQIRLDDAALTSSAAEQQCAQWSRTVQTLTDEKVDLMVKLENGGFERDRLAQEVDLLKSEMTSLQTILDVQNETARSLSCQLANMTQLQTDLAHAENTIQKLTQEVFVSFF